MQVQEAINAISEFFFGRFNGDHDQSSMDPITVEGVTLRAEAARDDLGVFRASIHFPVGNSVNTAEFNPEELRLWVARQVGAILSASPDRIKK